MWSGFGWLLGVDKVPAYVQADLRDEPDGVAVDEAETALPKISGGDDWNIYRDQQE